MTDMDVKEIYRAIGALTAEVQGLRRDIDASSRNMNAYGRTVEHVQERLQGVEFTLRGIAKTVETEVQPVVHKVLLWEQRGITVLALASVGGGIIGFIVTQFWRNILKLFS